MKRLYNLVDSMTISKTAMLKSSKVIEEQLELKVAYAEIITDENNQYQGLKESEQETTIKIDADVPIYLLNREDTLMPERVEWEDVLRYEQGGLLLRLFEKDREVILIDEIYIP